MCGIRWCQKCWRHYDIIAASSHQNENTVKITNDILKLVCTHLKRAKQKSHKIYSITHPPKYMPPALAIAAENIEKLYAFIYYFLYLLVILHSRFVVVPILHVHVHVHVNVSCLRDCDPASFV